MSGLRKKKKGRKIAGAIFTLVIAQLCALNFAYADTYTSMQNLISHDTTNFYWYDTNDVFLNQWYQFDLNNFPYWQATSTDPWAFQFIWLWQGGATGTTYSLPAPTGYDFWIIMEGGDIGYTNLHYHYGLTDYTNPCTKEKDITLSYKTLGLWTCPGFAYTPVSGVWFDTGYHYGYYATQLYAMVYTNDDLNTLITDEASMYAYLDNLNNYDITFQNQNPGGGVTLPAGTCDDLGTIAGALCRVITYLFVPTQASLDQYSGLKDQIMLKPPFGYYTSIKNSLNLLSSTSSPAFNLTAELEDITIFDTLKTGLGWLLWILFGFFVVKRIGNFNF